MEGSEVERNKEAGGKEQAPTTEKQANPGEALGIFTLPPWLLLQLCFPQLSSAARLPLSSLPSPIKRLPAFSSLLCAKEHFPQTFAKLLVLSFRFLSQNQLLLGPAKFLRIIWPLGMDMLPRMHGGNRVSSWHENDGVYFGSIICNRFVYLHVIRALHLYCEHLCAQTVL